MSTLYVTAIGRQFDASLTMLENAIRACPESLWSAPMWVEPAQFQGCSAAWYVTFHTLFWTDLYLTGTDVGFAPPAPYTLGELDPAGVLPERPYTPAELLGYLDYCRSKCRTVFEGLTDDRAGQLCSFPWGTLSFVELQVDNLRHVQEHGAQLRMLAGQHAGPSPRWVAGVPRPN